LLCDTLQSEKLSAGMARQLFPISLYRIKPLTLVREMRSISPEAETKFLNITNLTFILQPLNICSVKNLLLPEHRSDTLSGKEIELSCVNICRRNQEAEREFHRLLAVLNYWWDHLSSKCAGPDHSEMNSKSNLGINLVTWSAK
jgi:hypothetical protein